MKQSSRNTFLKSSMHGGSRQSLVERECSVGRRSRSWSVLSEMRDETQNDSAGNGETLQGPLKTRYALEYKFKCAAEVKVVEKPSRIRKIVKVTKGTC